jgi:PKD repeat protein
MPDRTRYCISFSQPLIAVLFLAFAIAILAGAAAGDGTMLVNLGDDVLTQEDTALTFNSAVSYTGTLTPTYIWTFGDGMGSSAQRPSHTYTQAGNYTVTLTVTDSDGISDTDTIFVEVLNVRPIADAGGDKTTYEGTTVTFDGSNSWDTSSDLALLTYEWDFGDGSYTSASMENKVITHTYAEAGVFMVNLVVRDDDWTSSNYAFIESQLIHVTGSATGNGTVSFLYDLGSPSGGSSGGNSSGSSGSGVEVCWQFGDGTYAVGSNVTHTFDKDGIYIATLIITDAFGAMSVHNIMVTVLNSPPTADAGSDLSGNEDELIAFNGGGSDPGGGPLTYAWDFGDGYTLAGQNVVHAYTKQGTYTVTLTVTDADGLTDTDTCSVGVSNVVPVAGLTSNHTTEEGDIIGFFGTTTYDTPSDLPLLVYIWSFGDGTTGAGSSVDHVYTDEGSYTVTLTVTDDDQAVDTVTTTFTVDNANPVACIDSVSYEGTMILPGETVSFSGSHTDAGSTDTHTYSWSFGDGSSATGSSATHSYSSDGTYTVTLTVTDNDGGVGTATYSLTVEPVEELADEALVVVEEAPTSSFEKPADQEQIADKFDDLIEALEGDSNNANGKATSLQSQINTKVSDEDLKEYLLDILDRILDSTG